MQTTCGQQTGDGHFTPPDATQADRRAPLPERRRWRRVPHRQQREQQPQPKARDVSGPLANPTSGPDTVDVVADRLAAYGAAVREAIETADSELGDIDTSDLFTEISRAIDKHLWFVEAHHQADA